MPGQGTLEQCVKCGERRKPPAMNEPCYGILESTPSTQSDYNPHA